jgi:hypothetical protein
MTDQQTTPANLMQNAQSYYSACGRLMDGNCLAEVHAPAFYLLVGFIIELSLKAVCLQGGCTDKELRKIGHRLDRAYESAMNARGVPISMTRVGLLVENLNDFHSSNKFRYTPAIEEIWVLDPRWCLDVLGEHLNSTMHHLYSMQEAGRD